MVNLQGCIELISTTIAEMMEDYVPDALGAHLASKTGAAADLEATGGDLAALARTLQVLRRRHGPH